MKKIVFWTFSFLALGLVLQACDDEETYAEKKENERAWINDYITRHQIQVITEEEFYKDTITDVSRNEYVYFDDSGVYMQIDQRGDGDLMKDGEHWGIQVRFTEATVEEGDYTLMSSLMSNLSAFDTMMCTKSGTSFSATFTRASGLMYSNYGASVPTGWLIPLDFVKPGYADNDSKARVRLIVPHSAGHSIASSYVTPYTYEITYQRGR